MAALATHIKEIILENFMSHTYSRIPFKPGVNIICGPNGAGKSSILLAMSVALGQTYTERSRRLSDLIRRGKDLARVTVVFDNSLQGGRRPLQSFNTDTFTISRYLSRDGNYWHEVNFRAATKGEVFRVLSRLSINPDNMLIIMHQNMIDLFGAIDASERLKLVEEAVGVREYREKIIEAREKLSHALSEEESVKGLLEKAEETLNYWEEQYGRYLRKKELLERREKLEVEYAWAKCIRQEEMAANLSSKVDEVKRELQEIRNDLDRVKQEGGMAEIELKKLDQEFENCYQELITHERMKTEAETGLKLLEFLVPGKTSPGEKDRTEENLKESENKIEKVRSRIVQVKDKRDAQREKYVNARVRGGILNFRKELAEDRLTGLKSELRRARRDAEELAEEAGKLGPRVKTERKPQDVLDELRMVNAHLMSLADVSQDVEQMYTNYKNMLEELKQRAEIAAKNRGKALEELEVRKQKWEEVLKSLIAEVGGNYRSMLQGVNATGDVRLVNFEDIEAAGLELLVGFRGAEPRVLDAYVQSGGERSTSVMCFLLALQQRIQSPVRAIDEFETHMDPRNRQEMMNRLLSSVGEEQGQYMVITPGQLVSIEKASNIITVQNTAGTSQVKVVK